jgi:hypothetical protein
MRHRAVQPEDDKKFGKISEDIQQLKPERRDTLNEYYSPD